MDEQAISAIKKDQGASATLIRVFEECNVSLICLLRARLRCDQEARDVAQEAYLRLLEFDGLESVNHLRQYLFRTALNIATDRLRSATMRAAAHRDPVFHRHASENSPERSAIAQQELSIVQSALGRLPSKIRYAFLLHRMAEVSIGEIARMLGVSERTIRNYIVKALLCCREALDGERTKTEIKQRDSA